jgi:hypothetical protein
MAAWRRAGEVKHLRDENAWLKRLIAELSPITRFRSR